MGILAPDEASVHVASFTMSLNLIEVSTGALWDCRLSRIHRRSQWPSHAKWQPHLKGLFDIDRLPIKHKEHGLVERSSD